MYADVKKFLDWKGLSRPSASKNYEKILLMFDKFTNKNVNEINLDDYIAFTAHLRSLGYSPASYSYFITILHVYIKFYHNQGECSLNPDLIQVPKSVENPHHALQEYEFEKLEGLTGESGFLSLRNKLIVRLLYETGIRNSELCDLQLYDIEENNATIKTKKTRTRRIIYWSDETNTLMRRYLLLRSMIEGPDSNHIFVSPKSGLKLYPRDIQRLIKCLTVKAGLTRHIVPHSFRHGKAHAILKQSGTVKDIQEILGHTSPVSSFRYLHLNREEAKDRAVKFLK